MMYLSQFSIFFYDLEICCRSPRIFSDSINNTKQIKIHAINSTGNSEKSSGKNQLFVLKSGIFNFGQNRACGMSTARIVKFLPKE